MSCFSARLARQSIGQKCAFLVNYIRRLVDGAFLLLPSHFIDHRNELFLRRKWKRALWIGKIHGVEWTPTVEVKDHQ